MNIQRGGGGGGPYMNFTPAEHTRTMAKMIENSPFYNILRNFRKTDAADNENVERKKVRM